MEPISIGVRRRRPGARSWVIGLVAAVLVALLATSVGFSPRAMASFSRSELLSAVAENRQLFRSAGFYIPQLSDDHPGVLRDNIEALRKANADLGAKVRRAQPNRLALLAGEIFAIQTQARSLQTAAAQLASVGGTLSFLEGMSRDLLDRYESMPRQEYLAEQRRWSRVGSHAVLDYRAAADALRTMTPLARKPTTDQAMTAATNGRDPLLVPGMVPLAGGCALNESQTARFLGNAQGQGIHLWVSAEQIDQHRARIENSSRYSGIGRLHFDEMRAANREVTRGLGAKELTPSFLYSRVFRLGYAWLTTQEEQFADRMFEDLDYILSGNRQPRSDTDQAKTAVLIATMLDWLEPYARQQGQLSQWEYFAEVFRVRHLGPIACEIAVESTLANDRLNKSVILNAAAILGALSTATVAPRESAAIVASAIEAGSSAWQALDSDGGSPEGTTYWNFQSVEAAGIASTADAVFGDDLPEGMPTFQNAADFAYHAGFGGGSLPLYSDARPATLRSTLPAWIAGKYGGREALFLADQGHLRESVELFWWRDEIVAAPEFRSRLFADTGLAVLREGEASVWLKGQAPLGVHTHLDAGTVFLDTPGRSWSLDMGYGATKEGSGYADIRPDGKRWTFPQTQPQWHSTIRIGQGLGQVVGATAAVTLRENTASVDLTGVLPGARNASRTVTLDPGSMLMRDTITLRRAQPVLWSWVTPGTAQIDGDTVILRDDGEELRIAFSDLPARSTISQARAPSTVSRIAGTPFTRVTVSIPSASSIEVTATFTWT